MNNKIPYIYSGFRHIEEAEAFARSKGTDEKGEPCAHVEKRRMSYYYDYEEEKIVVIVYE